MREGGESEGGERGGGSGGEGAGGTLRERPNAGVDRVGLCEIGRNERVGDGCGVGGDCSCCCCCCSDGRRV